MVTIEQARKQISQSREQLSKAQIELPKPTQQTLRQTDNPLLSRLRRKEVVGVRQDIQSFEKDLQQREQYISSFEKQAVKPQVNNQEEYNIWFRRGIDGKPLGDANSRQREYYRQGALSRSNQKTNRAYEKDRILIEQKNQISLPRGYVYSEVPKEIPQYQSKEPDIMSYASPSDFKKPSIVQKFKDWKEKKEVSSMTSDEKIRNLPIIRTFFKKEEYVPPTNQTDFSVIRKGSDLFWGTTQFIDKTSTKIKDKLPFEIKRDIPKGRITITSSTYDIPGELAVMSAFTPLMSLGTISKQASKQLSKNRFDELGKALGKLEKEVAEKKNIKEQVKILRDIKAKLKTNEEKENFKKWIESLINKKIIKVPTTSDYSPTLTAQISIEGLPPKIPIREFLAFEKIIEKKPKSIFISQEENSIMQSKVGQTAFFVQPQTKGLKELSILAVTPSLTSKQKSIQDNLSKLRLGQPLKLGLGTAQKLRSLLKTAQSSGLLQKTIQKTGTGKKIIIPIGKVIVKKGNAKITKQGEFYKVYVKRYGKDNLVGTFSSLIEAKKFLEDILRGTLARSGKILSKGTPQQFNLGFKFRQSKVEPERIVQRRKYSLGTLGERKEIQRARKNKKINWFK